eukprot:m.249568 g.249568  ORF g.249568 m.249568 type:complete len:55 (-) comp33876_c0_seq1:195-359(-)
MALSTEYVWREQGVKQTAFVFGDFNILTVLANRALRELRGCEITRETETERELR